jgi:protein-S-isoprenylcysteine O-methyltransferase Ste14
MKTRPDAPHAAPWFYRNRVSVFGFLFGVECFFGFLVAGILGQSPAPLYVASGRPAIFGAVVILLALGGWALRVWASSYLDGSVVRHHDVMLDRLRVSGPYRFTRNPLYLGTLLQASGLGLLGPWPVSVLIAAGMLLFVSALISVEEKFLSRESGTPYDAYRASVSRLIPLPWKIASGGDKRGSLREGLRTELGTAGFAIVTIIAVALTYPRPT